MPRVEITTAGHTVIVDDEDEDLDVVACFALDLHRQTKDPRISRAYGTSVGFTAEFAEEYDPPLPVATAPPEMTRTLEDPPCPPPTTPPTPASR